VTIPICLPLNNGGGCGGGWHRRRRHTPLHSASGLPVGSLPDTFLHAGTTNKPRFAPFASTLQHI
jgi:hypothetical protein